MEQIIDLIEGIIPGPAGKTGPRGPEGKQGLPAPDALPADAAVADWIGKTSATNTALVNHFGTMVSVRAYGAKGDGTTDDTDAIRTAIENNAGNTILFPAGTWLITESITIPEDTHLAGVGDGSLIIFDPAEDPDYACCFTITDGGNVSITDIAYRSTQALNHLRFLLRTAGTKCHDITIRRVHAIDHTILWAGNYGERSDTHNHGYVISDCKADNWRQWRDNGERNITTAVIELFNVDDFLVTNCAMVNESYEACGIQWWGGPQDNTADYTSDGGTWCHNGVIANNIVKHTMWSPIWGSHGAQMIIANNVMSDCSDVCLSIEAAVDMVIIGNHLSESNNGLVSFANSLRRVRFTGNTCIQSGAWGRSTENNQTPRQRFRIFIRWGCNQREKAIPTIDQLDITNNTIAYLGAIDNTNGVNAGVMELGGFAGQINFSGNTVINCVLNLFTRWLTGEWGLGDQNRNLWPGPWTVTNNHFTFDDADQRLAVSTGTTPSGYDTEHFNLRQSVIYCSNPFNYCGIIQGNIISSDVYATAANAITCYHIYTYRSGGQELWLSASGLGAPSKYKGTFSILDNHIERFNQPIRMQTTLSSNEVSFVALCARNHFIAKESMTFADDTAGNGAQITLNDNYMTELNDAGSLQWQQPWPNKEIKGTALDSLISSGVRIEPRGGMWVGKELWAGTVKRGTDWYYYGQFKTQ